MILQMHNINASQFADRIHVQRSAVSHFLSGRNNPSVDVIAKILEEFPRIDAKWLITGKQSTSSKGLASDHNSQINNKITEKVIVFYSDGTCEEYQHIRRE